MTSTLRTRRGRLPRDNDVAEPNPGFALEAIVTLAHPEKPLRLYSECFSRVEPGDVSPYHVSACGLSGSLRLMRQSAVSDMALLDVVLDQLGANPGIVLGCNISSETIVDGLSWSEIIRRIDRAGDLASQLVLEVSFDARLEDVSCAWVRLKAAKTLRCALAIDHYDGLVHSPVRLFSDQFGWDIIKLNKNNLCLESDTCLSESPLGVQIDRASHLAPRVVVMGVEFSQQVDMARLAGATHAQGGLFSDWPRQKSMLQKQAIEEIVNDMAQLSGGLVSTSHSSGGVSVP